MTHTELEARYWEEVTGECQAAPGQSLWRSHSDWVYARLLALWLPPATLPRMLKTDLFDEAVGEGLYPVLASRSTTTVGIDLSTATICQAQAQHPGLLATAGDVRRLPFANDTFDVVFSNSTLDHFRSRAEIHDSLAEILRVLRPGGQLLVTVDNLANPLVAVRNLLPFGLLRRLGLVPYYMGATLGPRGLRRALLRAGFEVMRLAAVLHCPRLLAVALAQRLERQGSPDQVARFLQRVRRFESLERWPTRFLTSYYVAALARKPGPDSAPRGEAWS